jgi:hypothetical protein
MRGRPIRVGQGVAFPDEIAHLEAKRRQQQKAEGEKAKRIEKKLERELAEEDAKAKVDPPPELSPKERAERELVERITALEHERDGRRQAAIGPPEPFNKERYFKREALRLFRAKREAAELTQREERAGLPKLWARFDKQTTAVLDKRNASLAAAEQRHADELLQIRKCADRELAELGPRPTLEEVEVKA